MSILRLAAAMLGSALVALCCQDCHQEAKVLEASVHKAAGCTNCHPKYEKYPHRVKGGKPACAQCHAAQVGEHARSVHGEVLRRGGNAPTCGRCHGNVHETKLALAAEFRNESPKLCGSCHSAIAAEFSKSIHGQTLAAGDRQAPVCTSCHGEHAIQRHSSPASPVSARRIRETCAQCHNDVRLTRRVGMPVDRVVSFDASYHGLALQGRAQTVANCASCHGVHNILPSSDAQSSINAKNLPATCGKCHSGAGKRFAIGQVHIWPGRERPASVAFVRGLYLTLIPVVVGLMVLHNGGNWIRKLIRMRFRQSTAPRIRYEREFRLYGFERITHALLMLSFGVLAWTGFQLQYGDQWWARAITEAGLEETVRGTIHRVAALVFGLTAVLHLGSLIASGRLRQHWKQLWPRLVDIRQGMQSLAYSVGLRSAPPSAVGYSFTQKLGYWAVVWGTLVMGATGAVLWAHTAVLARYPKEVLDVATAIHFYEAVLACLAVLVWHLYVVVFDPDIYPVNTAFVSGKRIRRVEAGAGGACTEREKAEE